jgi:hypothetical protein
VPPDVRRELAALALLRGHEAGRHVGLAVDALGVEAVAERVLHVDEDRVVLRRPAAAGLRAVVVRPHDLVEERPAPEERVEHDLRVVHLAVVEVQVERAGGIQQAPCLDEARLEEVPVVGERVVEAVQHALHGVVAAAVEAEARTGRADRLGGGGARGREGGRRRRGVGTDDGSGRRGIGPGGVGRGGRSRGLGRGIRIRIGRARHREVLPLLGAAGVERRIQVDELEGAVGERADGLQVLRVDHEVGAVGGPRGQGHAPEVNGPPLARPAAGRAVDHPERTRSSRGRRS